MSHRSVVAGTLVAVIMASLLALSTTVRAQHMWNLEGGSVITASSRASSPGFLEPDPGDEAAVLGKPPKDPPTPTPEPTALPPGGGTLGEMHVDFMVVTYGSTYDTYGVCRAAIVDSAGNRIDGAQVTFDSSDPFAGRNTVTQVLGENGDQARLEQRRSERYSCGKRGIPETFTCTVANVYHFDYTYVPELNVETTDSDVCSNF